jgi:hypothetical protein
MAGERAQRQCFNRPGAISHAGETADGRHDEDVVDEARSRPGARSAILASMQRD